MCSSDSRTEDAETEFGMDDTRADVLTTVPERKQRYLRRCHGILDQREISNSTSPKRRSSLLGKSVDKSSYCPGDRTFVNSVHSSVLKFAPDLSDEQLIPFFHCIDGAEQDEHLISLFPCDNQTTPICLVVECTDPLHC